MKSHVYFFGEPANQSGDHVKASVCLRGGDRRRCWYVLLWDRAVQVKKYQLLKNICKQLYMKKKVFRGNGMYHSINLT